MLQDVSNSSSALYMYLVKSARNHLHLIVSYVASLQGQPVTVTIFNWILYQVPWSKLYELGIKILAFKGCVLVYLPRGGDIIV